MRVTSLLSVSVVLGAHAVGRHIGRACELRCWLVFSVTYQTSLAIGMR